MIQRIRQPGKPPRDIDRGPGPVGTLGPASPFRAIGAVQLRDAICPCLPAPGEPERPKADPDISAHRRSAAARRWWADPANRAKRSADIRRGKAAEALRPREDVLA